MGDFFTGEPRLAGGEILTYNEAGNLVEWISFNETKDNPSKRDVYTHDLTLETANTLYPVENEWDGTAYLTSKNAVLTDTVYNTDWITGELGQNDFSLMNFVIPLRAKNKDEALKFALFLTNEQNQIELAKLTNIIATNKKALKNEFYTTYDSGDLMSKARVISAKQLEKVEPVMKSERNQKDINEIKK